MSERLRKIRLILKFIRDNDLPRVRTIMRVFWLYATGRATLAVMAYTPYLRLPERLHVPEENSWMSYEEYIRRAVNLNDLSFRPLLLNKANVFVRLGACMGRAFLPMEGASDEQIDAFLRENGTIVGKSNLSFGKGFHIYSVEKGDSAASVRADTPELLESYIVQHPEYSRMYPGSVNTIRIHTVRSREGVRLFFWPKLRVGADGAVTDVGIKRAYRVLLTEDGEILQAFSHTEKAGGMDKPCKTHHNTGYRFEKGKRLPFVRQAVELCLRAAREYPEVRYIGWDVAITENGPVIVEANDISGLWKTYQRAKAHMTAVGSRPEAEEMFAYAAENVVYDEDEVFFCAPLISWRPDYPSVRELYLVFLQTALHRHGVEFFARDYAPGEAIPRRRDCALSFRSQDNSIRIETEGREERLSLPPLEELLADATDLDASARTLSREAEERLECSAMHQAMRIYVRLILGCRTTPSKEGLAAYARFCTRLHTAYFWSAMGQRLDEKLADWVEQKYPSHYSRRRLAQYAALYGGNTYAFDCSGLIKSYFFGGPGAPEYDESRDLNSEGMFEKASRKGDIASLPEEPGLCLYREGHVGIYLGEGKTVDASPRHGPLGGVRADDIGAVDWKGWFECTL